MKVQIKVSRIKLEGQDPAFDYGSSHIGHAKITNLTPKAFTGCTAELYLGAEKAATSGLKVFNLPAGGSTTVDFPITMPSAEGSWTPLLDVIVAGVPFGYTGTEDVSVVIAPDIDVGPISWD